MLVGRPVTSAPIFTAAFRGYGACATTSTHDRKGVIAADALAMAVAIDPSIVTRSETRAVAVELDGRLTRGATVVDWAGRLGRPPRRISCWRSIRPALPRWCGAPWGGKLARRIGFCCGKQIRPRGLSRLDGFRGIRRARRFGRYNAALFTIALEPVMKPDIHPNNKPVVFQDLSSDFAFLTKSTMSSKETIKWEDGNEYPLIKVDISSHSHPFYTGKQKTLDVGGRVDKFRRRYAGAAKE
jgi:large subunit ribosomal protein L31